MLSADPIRQDFLQKRKRHRLLMIRHEYNCIVRVFLRSLPCPSDFYCTSCHGYSVLFNSNKMVKPKKINVAANTNGHFKQMKL